MARRRSAPHGEERGAVGRVSNPPYERTPRGGARRIRFAECSKGKSGGYRIITYFAGEEVPIFLLALFTKGERDNLSKAARNELRNELAGVAADYRASVRARAAKIKRRRSR
jgi:hypothetical protein